MEIFIEVITVFWQAFWGFFSAIGTVLWQNLPELLELKKFMGYFTPAGMIALYLGVPTIAVLVVVGWISPSKDFVFVITQAVFSAYIIEETVMLTIYKTKMDKLYNLFYTEFITLGVSKLKQQYLLLYYVVEFESVKAHYKVRLDSTWFNKHNLELSQKWAEISSKINIKSKLTR